MAYVNFISVDKNFVPQTDVSLTNFVRIIEAAKESGANGGNGLHERLCAEVTVKQAGYMYIYLSNDNPTVAEVYFDDFKVTQIKSPVTQTDDYYPFGLTFNSYSRENSTPNNFLYNGKELQDELNLGWLDYGARMFMPDIGRWSVIDGKSELYFATTPYAYALNQPTNAIDPDGNLVIFINGNHYGSGGGASYWRSYTNVKVGERYSGSRYGEQFYSPVYERRESYAFDKAVMNHVGDQHAMYRDGAVGGWAPVNPTGHELAFTRKAGGYLQRKEDAEAIIQNLAREKSGNIIESIKIITHSMGGAYGKGYAKALLQYAKQHNIQGVNIAFVADFAALQSGQLEAEQGENVGPTLQFSHSNDMVAGNDPEKGAQQQDTSGDKNQGHSIFSFMNQVSKLPTGHYRVVNGQIIPEPEKKKNNN
jgi:RHS repeat-associated protein